MTIDQYPGYRPKKWEEPADQIVRHKQGTKDPLCHYCHLPMIGGECWQCDAGQAELQAAYLIQEAGDAE